MEYRKAQIVLSDGSLIELYGVKVEMDNDNSIQLPFKQTDYSVKGGTATFYKKFLVGVLLFES